MSEDKKLICPWVREELIAISPNGVVDGSIVQAMLGSCQKEDCAMWEEKIEPEPGTMIPDPQPQGYEVKLVKTGRCRRTA